MATLNDNANAVSACATAIDAAITAKGGTLVGGGKLRNAAAGIQSIPSGSWPWSKPDNWPDIKAILNADTYQYTNKAICLRMAKYATVSTTAGTAEAYRFSDDADNISYSNSHTWDRSKDIVINGERFVWIIIYSNNALTRAFYGQGGSQGSANPDVLWVYGPNADVSLSFSYPFLGCPNLQSITLKSITLNSGYSRFFGDCASLVEINANTITMLSAAQCFQNCYSLKKVNATLNTDACTDFSSMWYDARSIINIPNFNTTNGTNLDRIFQNCHAAVSYPSSVTFPTGQAVAAFYFNYAALQFPNYLDFRNVTGFSITFTATAIIAVPETLLCNIDISLNYTTYQAIYKDKFARFENGEIVGGLAYNLNTISTAHTFTIGSTMKGFFTAEEQTKIADAFTNKGWTLAW